MKTIRVQSERGNYSILVGKGLLGRVGKFIKPHKPGKVMIVTQKPVAKFHLKSVMSSLRSHKIPFHIHTLLNGEGAKSQKELFRLYRQLLKNGFERTDLLIGLGGGVVGDLTGFAAATYLRGVPYVNIATTLLAQVDSAIGGKTAINLIEGKNLVGTFNPPKLVISDAKTLTTLSPREFRASLGEVVKYGVISDERLFRFLEKQWDAILKRKPSALERIVTDSARIKAGVVSRDEHETRGERMILNFGHTFGHAFEKVLKFRKWRHGEAVATGMVAACRLAVQLKLFSIADENRVWNLLRKFRLPVTLSGLYLRSEVLLLAMESDKKKKGGKVRFVLPRKIGKVIIRGDIPRARVRKSLKEIGAR